MIYEKEKDYIFSIAVGFVLGLLVSALIYPYFFVNLETQGVGGVAKWVIILLTAFVVVGFVFFGIDKIGKKKAV